MKQQRSLSRIDSEENNLRNGVLSYQVPARERSPQSSFKLTRMKSKNAMQKTRGEVRSVAKNSPFERGLMDADQTASGE